MEDTTIEEKKENEDILSKAIGSFGRWHIMQAIVLLIPTKFSIIWQLLAIVFLAPKTIFWCEEFANSGSESDTANFSINIENSTCYSECVKYQYYSEFDNTIISEWDLVCKRQWLSNLSQTMMMFGALVGSTIFGFFADRCGRKPAFICSCMIQLIGSVATSFCPYFWLFCTIRFIIGASTAGILITSYIIIIETTRPSKRETMNILIFLPSAIAETLMPLFSYYLRSWDKFSLGIGLLNLFFLVYFFSVLESPKWLVSMGRLEEASKVMEKIAKCNGLPSNNMLDVAQKMANEAKTSEKQKVKATYMDLIRVPCLRTKNLCSCIIWFTMGLSYYGVQQFMGQTSSNVFATIAAAGALQIPGAFISGWSSKLLGRRWTTIICSILFAICNGLLALPNDYFYVKLVMGSIGICMSFAGFAVMYMYTAELFPTVARNMGLGASSTMSKIGSMIAPFVAGLSIHGYWVPSMVFSIAPFIGAVTAWFLPETRGKELVDLLE